MNPRDPDQFRLSAFPAMHGTTILCARRGGRVVMGGDGQVTMGDMVVKGAARKIRKLSDGRVLAGFAGATADAFTLLERFERRLESRQGALSKAAEDLARDWRTDRVLRRLEAMLIVADRRETLVMSGLGDVLVPERGVAAIGSGAGYAEAAARALMENADLPAGDIVRRAMAIAADLCVFTNDKLTTEEIDSETGTDSGDGSDSGGSGGSVGTGAGTVWTGSGTGGVGAGGSL